MSKLFDFLIWIDVQILRVGTLGKAKPGETISAAAWSLYLDGKWQGRLFVPIIDWLFSPWQRNHCFNAYRWQINLYKDKQ